MTSEWKPPPKAKVYEAISAVLDGHVMLQPDRQATVRSSTGDKTYIVRWNEDLTSISSNDNASFYQGYIGYPIIAVLISLGKLTVDNTVSGALKAVAWKTINDRFKRDYQKAIEYVLDEAGITRQDRDKLTVMVDRVYAELVSLKLTKLVGTTSRPPVSPR